MPTHESLDFDLAKSPLRSPVFEVRMLLWDTENAAFDDVTVITYVGLSSASAIASVVHEERVFIMVAQFSG